MGFPAFFQDQTTPLTASFVIRDLGFKADSIIITNDNTTGTDSILISIDGSTTHGRVMPGETLSLDQLEIPALFLKYSGAAPSYRVFAYERI